MNYAFLGRSGLSISRLSFGTATFGGSTSMDPAVGQIGQIDLAEAQRIVGECVAAGINYFDTADVYSAGDSETILGKALGPLRQDVVIGTKATMRMGPGRHDVGSSRLHIIRACEDSLRRLRTDWIDLYQLHYPDALTPIEETLRAMDDLVRSGKVRYIGCSNFLAWQVVRATAVSDALMRERFVSHQISYSLTERDAEVEVIPACLDQNVGLVAWGPLAGGFLSGKYRRGVAKPAGARLEKLPNYPSVRDWNKGYDIVDVVCEISKERGVAASEVAINWALRKPWISSIVLGARTEEQFSANLKANSWVLTAEEVARLDAVSAPVLPYPSSIHHMINKDRTFRLPSYRS